jgi:hypothetical protein
MLSVLVITTRISGPVLLILDLRPLHPSRDVEHNYTKLIVKTFAVAATAPMGWRCQRWSAITAVLEWAPATSSSQVAAVWSNANSSAAPMLPA